MSGIDINAEELENLFARQDRATDQLDQVINGFPGPVDAGAASEYVAVLFQAAIEAASNTADTHRAMIAVARDVCEDLSITDAEAADVLHDMREDF